MKNLIRVFCLLLFLLLINCTKESGDNLPQEQEGTLSGFQIISKEDFPKNKDFRSSLGLLHKINGHTSKASIYKDSLTNFTIDLNQANFYYDPDRNYHSYTFTVIENGPFKGLRNIVLSENPDGSYKKLLITYDLTEEEILKLKNHEYFSLDNKVKFQHLNQSSFQIFQSRLQYYSGNCLYDRTYEPNTCASGMHEYGDTSCDYLKSDEFINYRAEPGGHYEISLVGCSDAGGGEPPTNDGGLGSPESENIAVTSPTPYSDEWLRRKNFLKFQLSSDQSSCFMDLNNTITKDLIINYLEMRFQNEQLIVSNYYYPEDAVDEVIEFLSITTKIPDAMFERFLDLKNKIAQNPFVLLQDCAQQNGMDTSNYIDLFEHKISQSCEARLNSLGAGYSNQPLTEGNVPCANIDYYSVEITTYPDFNDDGNPDTEAEIYQAFREIFLDLASGEKQDFQFSCDSNLDLHIDSGDKGDISWEFKPFDNNAFNDASLFVSSNPISAILDIEAEASGIGSLAADDGAIIVSDFTQNQWTISTISTPYNGSQPFSGNRQWGWLINQSGNLELFTRAVDVAKISKILNISIGTNTECQQDTYYNIAEATWKNLQQEIADWINSNGGQAIIKPSKAVRIQKEKIVEILTTNVSIDQVLSNCN